MKESFSSQEIKPPLQHPPGKNRDFLFAKDVDAFRERRSAHEGSLLSHSALSQEVPHTDEVMIMKRPPSNENSEESKELQQKIEGEIRQLQQELAALQEKMALQNTRKESLDTIPILFDSPHFENIKKRLDFLADTGLTHIVVGSYVHTLAEIYDLVAQAVTFCESKKEISDEEINAFLKPFGVTDDKISPHSSLSLKASMAQAMRNYMQDILGFTKHMPASRASDLKQ